MVHCPALAYTRDKETGAVLLDPDRCLGCQYCAWACPFEAPKFDPATGVMTKCTLCISRLREGLSPACTELCPTSALSFAELPEDEIRQDTEVFPQTDFKPRVKVVALDGSLRPPEMTAPATTLNFDPRDDLPPTKISLRSEWPLALFTSLVPLLVAAWTATLLTPRSLAAWLDPGVNSGLHSSLAPVLFGIAAAIGLGLSAIHLGRKERALRAVANVAGSWLSREIVLIPWFAIMATVFLAWQPTGQLWGWLIALLGFAGLFAVDRVYCVALMPSPGELHSASVVLSALFLIGVWIQHPLLVGVAGLARLLLYIQRKIHLARCQCTWRPGWTVMRLVMGFGLPAAIVVFDPVDLWLIALLAALLGDCIDRCEYYAELEILTPGLQMALELTNHTRSGTPRV